MQVKVLRAFYVAGARQEPGTIIELEDYPAREVIALGKAERVGAAAPAPKGPMTTESVSEIVQGKVRKGAKDAGQ